MRARRTILALVLAVLALPSAAARAGGEAAPNRIPWAGWDDATFARAKAERRIVLVVVSTSWCHWCHVMQRETYADARVERAVARAFLPIKVDGDARPDLSERFRRYRWPATGFLTPDGEPILALRGYRSAEEFLPILADVEGRAARGGPYPGFDAPVPPATVVAEPNRPALEALRARLVQQLDATYDTEHQGWGRGQKYPLAEPIEWGLRSARVRPADPQPLRRALDTLRAQEALLDREWGGMFQYSVGPGWNEPHYEKLVEVNAGALRAYADAYVLTGEERWKRAAANVALWFERFVLGPDGFRSNQDAEVGGQEASAFYGLDDAGRRRIGIPRVDPSVYARENGLAVTAHVAWALAAREVGPLESARRAAERVLETHREASGLFRHAAKGAGPRFLHDQAEMGRALLALGRATGEPRWMAEALRLAEALVKAFAAPEGGFYDTAGAATGPGALAQRQRSIEGNAAAARFLLGAAAAGDRPDLKREAQRAVLAVGDPGFVQSHGRYVGGLLLAVEEALANPRKVTLHGDPADARRRALLEAALEAARGEPDLAIVGAKKDAAVATPFAVVCAPDGTCSDPESDPAALTDRLKGVSLR
jgi:uncharacterized protein YyaL (SSP411 family)